MTAKYDEHFDADVIVVGGGITGSSFACLLGLAGMKVILLESGVRQINSLKQSDARIFSMTLASRKILTKAGVWSRIAEDDIGQFNQMHVWDENGVGEIHFDSATISYSEMGYIIPYQVIADALQDTLLTMDSIRCIWSVVPSSLQRDNNGIKIKIEDGSSYTAKLLVAADGANSKIRQLAGINRLRHDYKQSALACVVSTELPHKRVARQRFLKHGPLAFLPMAENHKSAIVWSTSPEHCKHLSRLDTDCFHAELSEAFAHELGNVVKSSQRFAFPLARARTDSYTQPYLALIGDSAHTIHPLAGQGANLGLLDAAALAQVVIKTHQRGRHAGRHAVLRRYERWRKGKNDSMMYLMDGFKYLFENQTQPLPLLRNIGLDLVNDIDIMKNTIMKHAMGLEGGLPDYAR